MLVLYYIRETIALTKHDLSLTTFFPWIRFPEAEVHVLIFIALQTANVYTKLGGLFRVYSVER